MKKGGIVYECIVIYLSRRCDNFSQIPRKDIKAKLGELFHIPQELREKVIQEMVEMSYLKRINRDVYMLA